jgi:phosphopantothenoylcysteine decarboxylase/phosphopantothenate--cysteine ligase
MARILLGVSGGIAAYKALELARLATRAGHGVRVLMTSTAQRFVGATSFEGIVGAPVLVDEFARDPLRGAFPGDAAPDHDPIGHLEVVANADVYLIAPASANTIAKLAAGIADSIVTTSFLACTAPRAVAPAMNDRMYADAATQANLATLRDRGVRVLDPEEGPLASRGEHGLGRLPSPERLLEEVEALLPAPAGSWDGLRVLVTAGGTREPIDPVRFIGNRSSGRMGLALAERAARRGAEVTLIAANVALREAAGSRRIDVETTSDLGAAVREEFPRCHVLLMAAAVADFRAERTAERKIERHGGDGLELRLTPTADILAELGRSSELRKRGSILVGFAAETESNPAALGDLALQKLRAKGADLIVANDVTSPEAGFGGRMSRAVLATADAIVDVGLVTKQALAELVMDRVRELHERDTTSADRSQATSKS